MTVYLDLLFLTNFMIDYLLLSAVARFFHLAIKWWRVVLGAVAGAAGGCFLFFLSGVGTYIFGLLLAGLMVLISFSIHRSIVFLKCFFLLIIESALLSGMANFFVSITDSQRITVSGGVIYYHTSALVLLIAISAGYIIIALYDRFLAKKKVVEKTCRVLLKIKDKECPVQCVIDTGNMLIDPISQTPVMVVYLPYFCEKFHVSQRGDHLFMGDNELRYHIIPCNTVGGSGIMKVISGAIIQLPESTPCVCGVGLSVNKIQNDESMGLINTTQFL